MKTERKYKKFISSIVALMMLVTTLPIGTFAADEHQYYVDVTIVQVEPYKGTAVAEGNIVPDTESTFMSGTEVALRATPEDDWVFEYWIDNNVELDIDPSSEYPEAEQLETAIISRANPYTFVAQDPINVSPVFSYEQTGSVMSVWFDSADDYSSVLNYDCIIDEYTPPIGAGEVTVSIDDFDVCVQFEDCYYVRDAMFTSDGDTIGMIDEYTYPVAPTFGSAEYEEWLHQETPSIIVAYLPHSHTEGETKCDETGHWKEFSCGGSSEKEEHTYNDSEDSTCECGYVCPHTDKELRYDAAEHWDYCTACEAKLNKEGHIDEVADDICDICECDMSAWRYFTFSNSTIDFFEDGEKMNYDIDKYEESFIDWIGDRYNYPGWRNDAEMILSVQDSFWGGSCFGYGVVESLFNLGMIDFSDYHDSIYEITQFPAPSQTPDKDIRSLLNYYYLTQMLADCRGEGYNIRQSSGRQEMLELAEYIVSEQNRAMFCYYYMEGGCTYGHAVIIDGGIRNEDGSYILNVNDNRYHGYKLLDDSDLLLQLEVTADGNARIYSPGGIVYKDDAAGLLYEFEEVIASFEYYKADEASFETFKSLLPYDENMIDDNFATEHSPKILLIPKTAAGTENMKVATDDYEVCVNDFAENTVETDVIDSFNTIYGGLSDKTGEDIQNKNTPLGVLFELNNVAENYRINSPGGVVSLSTENELISLTTGKADSAEFDVLNGVVSVDNNKGDFSIIVTANDGTIAKVSGKANGDITVTAKENTVDLDAPAGTYNVEYKNPDGTVTEDTIVIRRKPTGGGVTRYTVKFDTNGGSETADAKVEAYANLTEPESPEKEGYAFAGWYTDEELTEKYNFESKVTKGFTLYAKWEKADEPQPAEWKNPFKDVKKADWFFEDVRYVHSNGLMNGVSDHQFAPQTELTRAMLVTVLYRLEGGPATNRSIPFADVDMGAYYANAVIWAKQNDIVNGVSETEFAPNNNITREQIAAIMHRYAEYKGYDVSIGENTNILSYDDFDSISEYAIASVQYAVGSGLMRGKTESTLNPLDNATRAEIAAILHRFIEANK